MRARTEEDVRFREDVGRRLREARQRRGWTVRECGARADMQASQVSRFENGSNLPDASSLLRLAETLGVSTDWILAGRESAAAPPHDAPKATPGLRVALASFLYAATESGLARWAAKAPAGETPSVEEALAVLDRWQKEPATMDRPSDEWWAAALREIRNPSPAPKPTRRKRSPDELVALAEAEEANAERSRLSRAERAAREAEAEGVEEVRRAEEASRLDAEDLHRWLSARFGRSAVTVAVTELGHFHVKLGDSVSEVIPRAEPEELRRSSSAWAKWWMERLAKEHPDLVPRR